MSLYPWPLFEERKGRKEQRGKEGLPYKELGWLGQRGWRVR